MIVGVPTQVPPEEGKICDKIVLTVHIGGEANSHSLISNRSRMFAVLYVPKEIQDSIGEGDHRFIHWVFNRINPLQQGIIINFLPMNQNRKQEQEQE